MAGFIDRVKLSYQILTNRNRPLQLGDAIPSYNSVLQRLWRDTNSSVLAPIQTRIAIDVASVPIRHVRVDEAGDYLEDIPGELNDRLNLQANIDQSGFAFTQDLVMTMLDRGAVAAVPTDVTADPALTTAYDILTMRTGIIEEWQNRSVVLSVYNEAIGNRVSINLPKPFVAIVYNPLYAIMNEPNSTLKRLIDKRALLDLVDSKNGSPNLDLILQLPFAIRQESQRRIADERLRAIEEQLYNSAYGIAYVDATEKITQLNRPVVNNLSEQVDVLTTSLHNQLGLTESVFNGTANPEEMLAYYNRTIEPIIKAITSSFKMAFLTRTAIRQGQSIMAFPDLFKMAPILQLADASDKFTRNEIMSSNEVRSRIGLKQRKEDPEADELRNKNLNKEQPTTEASNKEQTKEVKDAETEGA